MGKVNRGIMAAIDYAILNGALAGVSLLTFFGLIIWLEHCKLERLKEWHLAHGWRD
jgi:hypothetical protein